MPRSPIPARPDRHVSRRTVVTALGLGAAVAAGAGTGLLAPSRAAAQAATAHTVGRVRPAADGTSVEYSWPGITFEGRFRGTGVGIVLDDADNDYDVEIDGEVVDTLVTPGQVTHVVDGLPAGEHQVRLTKRTESTWAAGRFGGFTAVEGGEILDRPAPRSRQVEFVGDSHTVGYGNVSDGRDCSANGGVNRNTNAGLSFGTLTARRLDADFQLNAYSGLGMVRNYNGGTPEVTYRTFYERALLHVDGDVWEKPASWRPQVLVCGLGINDFSTPLNAGERWATEEELVADYESAYHGFLDTLRERYGPQTFLVLSATADSETATFPAAVQRVVQARADQGDERISFWFYGEGLDLLGCDWHPSARDHELLADQLVAHLETLPLEW